MSPCALTGRARGPKRGRACLRGNVTSLSHQTKNLSGMMRTLALCRNAGSLPNYRQARHTPGPPSVAALWIRAALVHGLIDEHCRLGTCNKMPDPCAKKTLETARSSIFMPAISQLFYRPGDRSIWIDAQIHAYAANTPERPWHSVPNWPAHVTNCPDRWTDVEQFDE